MESELLEAMYNAMIKYVSSKEKQGCVDHVVSDIIDAGADEETLQHLSNVDRYLKRAILEQTDMGDHDDDEEY